MVVDLGLATHQGSVFVWWMVYSGDPIFPWFRPVVVWFSRASLALLARSGGGGSHVYCGLGILDHVTRLSGRHAT